MNSVIYARYSDSSQREESIEGQVLACKKYAEENGMAIIHEYIDRAMTATNDNRPQFQQMLLDSSNEQFEIVLVYQLDRFARNRHDSVTNKTLLAKNGVRVLSVTEHFSDDPEGKLIEGILESIADYFSLDLARKVRRGMRINAEKEIYNGGTLPLGYKIDENRKFQIDPITAPIVVRVFERYANGDSVNAIIEELNENGVRTTRGTPFKKNSFSGLLRNKRYLGYYINCGVEIPNESLRIVSDELFESVQQRNSKHVVVPASKDKFLLTGKLYCGNCEKMMPGTSGTSHTGNTYNYYMCNKSRGTCTKKTIRKEYFEDIIVNLCRDMLTDERINEIAKKVSAISAKDKNAPYISSLKKELAQAMKARERLLSALEKGQEAETLLARIGQRRQEIETFEIQLAKEALKSESSTEPEILFFLNKLKNGDINTLRYRKALISLFINRIYVYDDRFTVFFNTKEGGTEIKKELNKIAKGDPGGLKGSSKGPTGVPKKNPTNAGGFFL